ncbi:MAG: tetratricopeptide repeat protein [Chloroflexi bacterium]|nr:tetratricopeptide repeat protein [Chloroflexota bacterium]
MTPAELKQIVAEADKALDGDQPWVAVALYTDILSQTDPKTSSDETKEMRLTALYERGRILSSVGEGDAALAAYEQYLYEAPDDRHRARAIEALGSTLRRMGRFQEAREKFEEALKLAEAIMYPYGRAKALQGLGTYHHLMGHEEEAQKYLQMAYALYKSSGSLGGQIDTLISVGLMQSYNQIDKAIHTFNEALNLARNQGKATDLIAILNNLGECYQDLFDMEQALAIHREALTLALQARLRPIQSDLFRNVGVSLFYLGQLAEAKEHLQQALQISQETNDADVEAQTLYSLVVTELGQDHIDTAENYADQLLDLANRKDSPRYRARSRYALGLVKQKQGDSNAAAEQWQQALFLAHQTHQQMLLWQIHASLAEASPIPGLGAVHLRIAAEIIQQIAQPISDEALRQKFLSSSQVTNVLSRAK